MDVFAALADPTRRRIVELVSAREMRAGDIAEKFEGSLPTISQHLKKLKEAGLVDVRVDAQWRWYSVNPAGFAELEAWFGKVRSFWNPRLDRLEEVLRAAAKTHRRGRSKKK